MSGDEGNESGSSLPELPTETSHGSSVSSEFVNEYDELLKYAIVAPRFTLEQSVYHDKVTKDNMHNEDDVDGGFQESMHEKEVSFKVNPSYKSEKKILQAKKALQEDSHMPEAIPASSAAINNSNTLECLLEYPKTPVKDISVNYDALVSSNSTPESGVCSPSNVDKVDKGLLRMENLMDEWCLQLKQNVLGELANIKAQQIQDDELALGELKSKHNVELKKHSQEIDSLKELIYSFEQSVKQKDDMIENLTDALKKQKEKSDKIRMFSMWRLKSNDERRQEFASKMADKFYKKTLCTKVWEGWRSVVENKWKVRVEKACQIKSQEVCLKLTEDYEERLQGVQKELASARADVAQLHKERECYEENMKKAFMRGVCALNMEAMTMFREGGGNVDNTNNTQCNDTHYSCTESVSVSCETQSNSDNMQAQAAVQNSPFSKKHVTFNQPLSDNSNVPNCKPSQRPTNTKSLHVKITGKKENTKTKTPNRSSRPSSISSIKVERHVPHDAPRPSSQQGSLKPNFQKEVGKTDVGSTKRTVPRSVKVVD